MTRDPFAFLQFKAGENRQDFCRLDFVSRLKVEEAQKEKRR